MTVWAVHPIKYDVTAALKFGELRYINKGYVYGDELNIDADPFIKRSPTSGPLSNVVIWTLPPEYHARLVVASSEFSPGQDYLLIIGDHLQLMQLTAMLLSKLPYIDVLRYDRKISDYIPVRLHSILDHT